VQLMDGCEWREAWNDECGYKENKGNKAISAMARASTGLCLILTERAMESNNYLGVIRLTCQWLRNALLASKNVTFLSIGDWHGDSTSVLLTAFLYN
jgi:hypothetical protein